MKTLDSFLKKQQPKRRTSKLKKYEQEIRELYHRGYKVEQIQEFLLENNIKIEIWGIYKFLNLNQNLTTQKSSFKNPAASKEKKISAPKIKKGGKDKAMAAFFSKCQKTADSIKKYNKEKEQ